MSIGQEPAQQIKEAVQWDSIKSDDDYTKFIKLIKNNSVNQKKTINTESGKEEILITKKTPTVNTFVFFHSHHFAENLNRKIMLVC